MPLGKMIQRLKSQGAKGGKAKKKKLSSAEVKDTENDVDILKMVREINLDNMGVLNKFESSNGHKHFPSKQTKVDLEDEESKKRKATDVTSIPVPKRRRSLSAHGGFRTPKSNSKAPLRASGDGSHHTGVSSFQSIDVDDDISESEVKITTKKKKFTSNESDSFASRFQRRRSFSSKHKGKSTDLGHDNEAGELGEADEGDLKVSIYSVQFAWGDKFTPISCGVSTLIMNSFTVSSEF